MLLFVDAITNTNPVAAFALTLTRSHTRSVCVRLDDAGKHVMEDRTETFHAGERELLIAGELAFVRGWTRDYPGAYQSGHGWQAMPVAEARVLWKRLRSEGYVASSSPKVRVLGWSDFAGGKVWHSWGEGANRCGHVDAPKQVAPVIASMRSSFDHAEQRYVDRLEYVTTLYALEPGRHVERGDVAHCDRYTWDAAKALLEGKWHATDAQVQVENVDDARKAVVRLAA